MKRILPLLLLFCLLVCTACGATKTVDPTTTPAAVSITELLYATTTDAVSAASAAPAKATAAARQTAATQATTVAATMEPHTTLPHSTAPVTTAAATRAVTTRRIYTTTPFTTKAKVKPTTTRPAATTTVTVPTEAEEPTAAGKATTRARAHTCTVSINCSVALENSSKLKPGKAAFVPTGGQILAPTTVTFTPGEDAYTVLRRACEENTCADRCQYCAKDGIQYEAAFTPGYNTYYVQGIHQIYEKDCGPKSGWLYRVNGDYPNVGSSSYTVQDGDRIEWIYALEPVS